MIFSGLLRPLRWAGLLLAVGPLALLAQTLELSPVPAGWPEAARSGLEGERAALQARWDAFQSHRAEFASAFAGTRVGTPQAAAAAQRKAELTQEANAIVEDADRFNARVAQVAREQAAAPAAEDPEVKGQRVIDGLNALAAQWGWSQQKRDRLDAALHALSVDGAPTTVGEVKLTWQAIKARGDDPALAAAARAAGPGAIGAGQQTNFDDCAVFALASATNQPYGVVAARATQLLREGHWRTGAEHADPQGTIERIGLNGGEVIMLAEMLGEAEVVSHDAFASTLRAGRPILVNVYPSAGRGAHEIVVTKAFSHDGQEWFEVLDSNHGPQGRYYLTDHELDIIQQEKGVAYRPAPGQTVVPPS